MRGRRLSGGIKDRTSNGTIIIQDVETQGPPKKDDCAGANGEPPKPPKPPKCIEGFVWLCKAIWNLTRAFAVGAGAVGVIVIVSISYGMQHSVPVKVDCPTAKITVVLDKGKQQALPKVPALPDFLARWLPHPTASVQVKCTQAAEALAPAGAGGDGSQFYRQSPGAEAPKLGGGGPPGGKAGAAGGAPGAGGDPGAGGGGGGAGAGAGAGAGGGAAAAGGGLVGEAPDGLPVCTKAGQKNCVDRWQMLSCSDKAKYWLNRGEAEVAIGRVKEARRYFSNALNVGRKCGSEYSVTAAKRLAALNLTCEYTPDSLARIARGFEHNKQGGALINLKSKQQALKALGHYSGRPTGRYNSATRAAITSFQREYGFSETGDLTPIETVYLMCGAAQNANDVKSTNMLGIMYIGGLGVVQSTDIGLRWLKAAAARGNADALYNLAVIYGTGTVLQSYRLCAIVQNTDVANAYLAEAAAKGHPVARQYMQLKPSQRWAAMKKQLKDDDIYQRLEKIGNGCEPN